MGLYSKVAVGLPRAEPRDGKHQAAVDKRKAELSQAKEMIAPAPLAKLYASLKADKAVLEAEEKALSVNLAAVEQLMWGAFESAGVESLRLDVGYVISVSPAISVSVADRAALNDWARQNGLQDQLTLPSPTIESIMKERLLAGAEIPACVTLGSYNKTNFRKG